MNLSATVLSNLTVCVLFAATLMVVLVMPGCEKKERVVGVQAPGFGLEVNKTASHARTSSSGDLRHEIKIDAMKTKSKN